jgi:hypothetical protein
MRRTVAALSILTCCSIFTGCAGRAELLPNSDKNLRKTSAEFAADAAKRFPYKTDAERGGQANGRAQVGYWMNVLDVVNLSDANWEDVEIWINKSYVVHLPLMEPNKLKRIPFQALYNDQGQSFPTKNNAVRVQTVEVHHGGKMFDVPVQLGD